MPARYALYFAPDPASALWRFGSRTLGYDAATGASFPPVPPASGLSLDWGEASEEPRRYGFHATLKAPFELHPERRESELVDALAGFAANHAALGAVPLTVAALGAFIALVPAEQSEGLQALALRVVRDFEPFRAPLSAADRARRLASPLSERQIAHLDHYGYPYVDEDFRFHMTLTGKLPPGQIAPVRAALADAFVAEVSEPAVPIDALALYRQPSRADRFEILFRAPLAPSDPQASPRSSAVNSAATVSSARSLVTR